MILRPFLLRLAALVLLATTVPARGDDPAAPAKPMGPIKTTADVQRSSPSVLHRIGKKGYTVLIRHVELVQGNQQRQLRIESPGLGAWGEAKLVVGNALTAEPAVAEGTPAPARHGLEFRFARKTPLRAEAAEKHFVETMQIIEKATDEIVKKRVEQQSLDEKAARDFHELTLKRLMGVWLSEFPAPVRKFRDYEILKFEKLWPPRFVDRKVNPKQTIQSVFDWIEADRMLHDLGWSVESSWSEDKILRLSAEMKSVLTGDAPADAKFKELREVDLAELQKFIRIRYEVEFTPQRAKDARDDGWIDARRVALSPEAAGTVLWNGDAGRDGEAWKFDWLAFHSPATDEELEIRFEKETPTLCWALVSASEGWRYVRVASRRDKGTEPFTLRLSTAELSKRKDRIVTLPSRPAEAIKFPF